MLFDLLNKNRSYRNFDSSRQITRQELEKLVTAARISPAARNLQPLKYYLSSEPETNKIILQNIRFAADIKDRTFPTPGMEATAYIIICHDTDIFESPRRFWKDVGIVAQSMMLAATEMGLGGCMIGSLEAEIIAKELKLPDNLLPQLILVLGKPAEAAKIVQAKDGNVVYYRDEEDVQCVPKRSLEELIIN